MGSLKGQHCRLFFMHKLALTSPSCYDNPKETKSKMGEDYVYGCVRQNLV